MLAALGKEDARTDAQHARAYVGALLLVEAVRELRTIRKMLTPKES
jgi:hypothetical protein